jgi:magnesium chelatase subunit H
MLSAVGLVYGLAAFTPTRVLNGRSAIVARSEGPAMMQNADSLPLNVPMQLRRAMRAPEAAMVATGGGGPGLFTNSKPGDRKIVPDDVGDREVFKVVYVVLESQYQASLSTACKRINAGQPDVAVECSGYILEELRDEANFQQFKKDVEEANIFIGSLIFVQELADKVVSVVEPNRDRLDAVCVFPSMPAVMKLNKIGSFTMAAMGQSKNVMSDFMKKNKPTGTSFQDGMLKLVRTLPKVLKYLPGDKAKDARTFMMSLQYWLGGSPENIEALLLNLASNYVKPIADAGLLTAVEVIAPEVIPDKGIWHPVAPRVFDTYDEYMTWLRTEHAPSLGIDVDTAPIIGVVLQKSHINTRDDAHYVALIMEMEAKGALVVPTYTGSLDFSLCVDSYFFNAAGKAAIDVMINLTGFALVGGPATQDHPKAIATLKKLNRPYLCAVPATFLSLFSLRRRRAHLIARLHSTSMRSACGMERPVTPSRPAKMIGSMAPSSSGSATWRATCTGCRPSSESFHSSKVWKVAGTAHRYGRLSFCSVAIALGWSCEAGPPTSAKPVRLISTSMATLPAAV